MQDPQLFEKATCLTDSLCESRFRGLSSANLGHLKEICLEWDDSDGLVRDIYPKWAVALVRTARRLDKISISISCGNHDRWRSSETLCAALIIGLEDLVAATPTATFEISFHGDGSAVPRLLLRFLQVVPAQRLRLLTLDSLGLPDTTEDPDSSAVLDIVRLLPTVKLRAVAMGTTCANVLRTVPDLRLEVNDDFPEDSEVWWAHWLHTVDLTSALVHPGVSWLTHLSVSAYPEGLPRVESIMPNLVELELAPSTDATGEDEESPFDPQSAVTAFLPRLQAPQLSRLRLLLPEAQLRGFGLLIEANRFPALKSLELLVDVLEMDDRPLEISALIANLEDLKRISGSSSRQGIDIAVQLLGGAIPTGVLQANVLPIPGLRKLTMAWNKRQPVRVVPNSEALSTVRELTLEICGATGCLISCPDFLVCHSLASFRMPELGQLELRQWGQFSATNLVHLIHNGYFSALRELRLRCRNTRPGFTLTRPRELARLDTLVGHCRESDIRLVYEGELCIRDFLDPFPDRLTAEYMAEQRQGGSGHQTAP